MKNIEIIQSHIYSWDRLEKMLFMWRMQCKKIVFTNGCFDIFHLGHLDYLSKAAELGDILVVGINSDLSVKKIKSSSRPIIDEKSRTHLLASLFFVDAVVPFDDDTPYKLIKLVQPDILVKGNDYLPQNIVGYDIVSKKNGQIITIELVQGYSTSNIEQKIINNLK